MAKRRDILSTLNKPALVDLALACGMDGLAKSRKETVLDALVKLRRLSDQELLGMLKRDDLKAACRELGLDDSGRAKQKIVARLLGGDRRGQSASAGKPATTRTGTPRPMAKKKSKSSKRPIEQYDHADKLRANNPPVGLVTHTTDPEDDSKTTYQYDPHLDPQLVWAGKAERTSFAVPTVSLHVHERIDPRTIIDAVRARNGDAHADGGQMPLFESPDENPPLRDALDFYRHPHNWTNRLIAGDSLLVMNSLLEKEGMAGKVQMVYIDPPYGITYGSNFQPFVNKRDVKDRKDEDLTQEPEMIRAFRDTWELGIHSYLTYLRDRLLLAKELVADSGSCFVQISAENLHRVRSLLDEVFGPDNYVESIAYRTKNMTLGGTLLEGVFDYIIWYAKDKSQVKFRRLFGSTAAEGDSHWNMYELPDGSRHKMTADQVANHALLPEGAEVFQLSSLYPAGSFDTGLYTFEYEGRRYTPPAGRSWKTPRSGMDRLAVAGRLYPYKGGQAPLSLEHKKKLWQLRRAYKALILMLDEQLGRILDALRETGQLDDTVILFSSDHGDLLGDHGCTQKGLPFKQSVTVPACIRHPDHLTGRVVDSPIELTDLTATILDVAGLDPQEALAEDWPSYRDMIPGRSLMPILRGETDRIRDHAFSECDVKWHEEQDYQIWSWQMIATDTWKYIRYVDRKATTPEASRDEWLIHRPSDPQEILNRADDPACADVLTKLSRQLDFVNDTTPTAQTNWIPFERRNPHRYDRAQYGRMD